MTSAPGAMENDQTNDMCQLVICITIDATDATLDSCLLVRAC